MIGQRLADRYEILDELGRGGMGVVYRAKDPVLNREVAIKVIAPSLLTPETETRFQNEAQVVARLDHPAIVSIHDFGRHEGSLFFVMPVVKGQSLRQLIRERSLVLGDTLDIVIGVAEALDYSEGQGIIHRDIKPENIMVAREAGAMRARVMDFGLARASEVSRITKTGMMVGTMFYTSPEQVSGKPVDHRSDLYSLGTVLYECLGGDVPFAGEAQSVLYRIIHEIPQALRDRGADVDPKLEALVMGCLEKDPARRPQHASELAQGLRAYRSALRDSERQKSIVVSRILPTARPALAPFVGRDGEIKELQTRLNAAMAGECQFVVVSGEEGVGKTRLLEEMENLARARDVRVLHGRFVEQDGAFPYHGFCEAIQEYFRLKESGDSTSSGLPDFSDLGGELVSVFPMLAEIDAIRTSSEAPAPAGPDATARGPEDRTQVFELLARTLARLAGGKPLLLLFEELHGADVSIEALQYVVRRLGPTPTLILGTYRSTEIDRRHPLAQMLAAFRGDRRFSQVELEPFDERDYRAFLTTLIGDAEFADDLAHKLYEGTKGNPFFTKELVRSLLDAGNIVRDESGIWSFAGTGDLSSEVLPATIQQAVEERLARLPEDLRAVLSVAAVIGTSFEFDALEELAGDDVDLDDAVDRLIQAGLIEEERQSRGDTLEFTSGVIREVLYADLSRRKRRSLHRKVASHLEKRHAGKIERVYPQLVYHCAEGDLPEKTVEYALAHARKSLETFSPEDAVRAVASAMDFLEDEWEGDPLIEGEARVLRASAHQMQGDTESALKQITEAVAVFEKEGETARAVDAQLEAARAAWQARLPAESAQWVEKGLAAARAADRESSLREFLGLAATLANLRGDYDRAREYLQEAEKLGDRPAEESAHASIPDGGTLVVALANPIIATEPATMETVEEWEIFSCVVETLVTTDAQGNLVPALAETWSQQDDGRAFIFTLREGVRFQGGAGMTAADVKSCFEHTVRASGRHPVPAFSAVRGVDAFLAGRADGIEGLEVLDDRRLAIGLQEPLPIYPALLSDERTAVYRLQADGGDRTLIGTGPFRLAERTGDRVLLEKSADTWHGAPPHVDAVEFRHGMSAAAIAAGLRSGDIDVAGDLLPQDLDAIVREPRFRNGFAQAPKNTTYFVVFNTRSGKLADRPEARQALSMVVRPEDLVWRTLGRLALPAVGLLPPGMLGHDPGKRRRTLTVEEARKQLADAGISGTLTLRAAAHPILQDRYATLLQALLAAWSELDVKVEIATADMTSFMASYDTADDIDMRIMRWVADYNDPDNFTHNLFNSGTGQLRIYHSSAGMDALLDRARAEASPSERSVLYRQFENGLLEDGALLPLFHELEYRVSSPRVRGLAVRSKYPCVNYAELGKADTESDVEMTSGVARALAAGTVRVPMSGHPTHLDPALAGSVEDGEILPTVFEGLTRTQDDRIEPWLAESFLAEESGRVYRFRLRPDVLFHDGRRLTARDVRYSFERLLQTPESMTRWHFDGIRGAKDVLEGRSRDLTGIRIHSTGELSIELERPLAFFPVLLADLPSAIVPEGTGRMEHGGAVVGTGPFRVVRHDPGHGLILERHADYWRPGYPRSEGIEFSFGVAPAEILSGFRAGRFSIAGDLFPEDVETLRRDPAFAAGYRDAPSLSTYYAAFNVNKGPMASRDMRRMIAGSLDLAAIVRQTLGRRGIPAQGWIPPGLIGHEPGRRARPAVESGLTRPGTEVTVALHPVFTSEYEAFVERFLKAVGALGVKLDIRRCESALELIEGNRGGSWDLSLGRWYADYADADTFAHVLHRQEGDLGRLCGLETIDELVRKGREESNPRARHALYREMEQILAEEAVLLPLFHEQVYRFARPEISGLNVSYLGSVSYDRLTLSAD